MANRLVRRSYKTPVQASKDPLERLRENYPRRASQPVSMAQAVSAFLGEFRKLNKSRRARIQGALELALGDLPDVGGDATHARVDNISKDGVVHVTVEGSTLAHEIGVVYKAALLQKMRALLQGKDSLAGIVVKAGRAARTRPETDRQAG